MVFKSLSANLKRIRIIVIIVISTKIILLAIIIIIIVIIIIIRITITKMIARFLDPAARLTTAFQDLMLSAPRMHLLSSLWVG